MCNDINEVGVMDSTETEFSRARTRAKLTCNDAALFLGLSVSDIEQMDSGATQPPPRFLAALNGISFVSSQPQPRIDFGLESKEFFVDVGTADRARKSRLGQFFTPESVADFMASLFTSPKGQVRLLDAGAGEGALTSAFVSKWQSSFWENEIIGHAFECDEQVFPTLESRLRGLGKTSLSVVKGDFLELAATMLQSQAISRYSHAILNPPYKKIGVSSLHREFARRAGFETVNLYSAFVGVALALLESGGELVAIIPRSFCNGPYYKGFRQFILDKAAIKHIHVFGKRNEAFAADGVLQENIILKLVAAEPQGNVTISRSSDHRFSDYNESTHVFSEIVIADDDGLFIHIPTTEAKAARSGVAKLVPLEQLELTCSTGPLVDFRVKGSLRSDLVEGSVPLLYPAHFSAGKLNWPKIGFKKSNAIDMCNATRSSLWPSGYYTVVRRFSSKEERRRVYAAVVEPKKLPTKILAFENHLNVFHFGKKPIEEYIAWGLAAYLNSSHVDNLIRSFSGHTQVNATDLRTLRYPPRDDLAKIGKWFSGEVNCDQKALDNYLEKFLQ
jgi:adenine-specific DNA-methyltransferase